MRPHRGKQVDDGEWVYGWYCKASGRHLIIQGNARLVNPRGGLVWETSPNYYIDRYVEVDPETVSQFVCKDRNGKEVWFDDNVLLKRGGFKSMKLKAIAGFENWVWLYWKDHSTYHWEIAYIGDIELIEETQK